MPMILYDASINDVSIHSLAEEIILRDIVENPAEMDIQTAKRAMHPGMRETSRVRRKLEIELVFVIYTQDSRRRTEVCSKVAQWANAGGWLTINTRPGLRLYVRPTAYPAQNSALRWQEDITLTLTAYEQPYWEDDRLTKLADVTAAYAEAENVYYAAEVIKAPGNLSRVPMTCQILNTTGAAINRVKIVIGDTMMELSGLSELPDLIPWIKIGYTDDDILTITEPVNESSLLKYRRAESSDDLMAPCGVSTQMYVYADAPVRVVITTRGRWL